MHYITISSITERKALLINISRMGAVAQEVEWWSDHQKIAGSIPV